MALTVDEQLLRGMARDAAIYALTRPVAIVMWIALLAAFVVSILNLTATDGARGLSGLLPVASVALMVYAVVMTVAGARRAVRAATPPGSTVWLRLDDTALHVGAGSRSSDISYSTFQSVRAGRHAVLFKLRDASAITAVPRALLTDDDIGTLRSRIG
ncbi:YcxB family protein [Microbacterium sp. APC 3901]|uniref:YcxB family protein n=1 Tax=Microbacterium sp. APC 3901 TaxID=3035192 RepID=UPI0025B31ADA|nr:YcxB family protein [Microbacterium sp. APC 3901]MDN3444723.1 YcxB family protein [Microbacterium sp. APC 3901]